jgi:hypothetical protein
MTRGHRGSLLLRCKAFSSSSSCRFIPAHPKSLSDQRELAYEGSEEATIASRHHLRVKDLAAALVAAIRGVAFVEDPAPAARDAAIARLASDRGLP